jgi:hypothetical protein
VGSGKNVVNKRHQLAGGTGLPPADVPDTTQNWIKNGMNIPKDKMTRMLINVNQHA